MSTGYHVQLLAMTSQLASPGVADMYRECAVYFR